MRNLSLKCRVLLWTMACLPIHAQISAHTPLFAPPSEVTSAAVIRSLSAERAKNAIPVHVLGVVTFYDPVQQLLFFQDSTGPIYVDVRHKVPVIAGSRVEIWGTTGREYSNQIEPAQIREISRGPLPKPVSVDYAAASNQENDCRFVTMQGIVRSATRQKVDDWYLYLFELEVEQRIVEVAISNYPNFDPSKLLDATVRVNGVLGGRLDVKNHILGLVLHVSDASEVSVSDRSIRPSEDSSANSLDALLSSDHALIRSERLYTRGTVTLYDPGERLVIKSGNDSLYIQTRQQDSVSIGQLVEVTGFPTAVNGSPALERAQFWPVGGTSALSPRSISFADAMSGSFRNELVTLEGEIVSETREEHLDTLTLRSGDHVFQAVFPKIPDDPDPIPVYPPGTRIRVSGVCIVHVRGFWGVVESFQIHLRSARDVSVVSAASWWTVRHMLVVTSGLLVVVLMALIWGLWMRRRLSAQETLVRSKIESEAARLAVLARLAQQRSTILELINSFEPLPGLLNAIHVYVAEMWPQVFSYSHVLQNRKLVLIGQSHLSAEDAARLECIDPTHSFEACAGAVRAHSLVPPAESARVWSRLLVSSQGEILGTMTFESQTDQPVPLHSEALNFGCNLAVIAIDNRRLYEDVVHRSQHDQLTGLPNRTLLEARLEQALDEARKTETFAALLFLDLDAFKRINDSYGHRVGDLYLCEVAERLQAGLRDFDTLARVGGDEFIACIAGLSDTAQAYQIANRLVQTMHRPFSIEGASIRGTVSVGMAIFPESGHTSASLTREADAAMYAAKRAGGNQMSSPKTQSDIIAACKGSGS